MTFETALVQVGAPGLSGRGLGAIFAKNWHCKSETGLKRFLVASTIGTTGFRSGTKFARLVQAGRAKNSKYLAACREADYQFIPMVLDAFGGWSPAARYVIQHGCRTVASASSWWTLASARRWWTQRLFFALWRGNAQAVQGCLAGDEHRHPARSRLR
jgi:hypothetical protein